MADCENKFHCWVPRLIRRVARSLEDWRITLLNYVAIDHMWYTYFAEYHPQRRNAIGETLDEAGT